MKKLFINTNKSVWAALLLGFIFISLSTNPPQGNTGAPFEGRCNRFGCHFSGGSLSGKVEILGIPSVVERGQSYNLKVLLTATNGSPVRGGFQMTAVDQDQKNGGTLSLPDSHSTLSSFNGRTYFEHQPAQRFEGKDSIMYAATWTAPNDFLNNETTTFYVSAMLANGNNNPSGDTYLHNSTSARLKTDSTSLILCNETINLVSSQDDISAGNFLDVKTSKVINASNKVRPKGNLGLRTGAYVQLNPGFQVDSMALFEVTIENCVEE